MKIEKFNDFFNEEFKHYMFQFNYNKEKFKKFLKVATERCSKCSKHYYIGCDKRCNCKK